MQQRLVIKKSHVNSPKQLSDELEELKKQVDANTESLEKANAKLAQLKDQKAKLEAHKAHVEIKQLTSTISTLESSIAKNKEEKKQLSDELGEKSRIANTLSSELRQAAAEYRKATVILSEYDAVYPQLTALEAKLHEYESELELATVSDSKSSQAIGEKISQIDARIEDVTNELTEVAAIVKRKEGPHFFTTKNKTLTIDEIRTELKQLEANEQERRTKYEEAQREIALTKLCIVDTNEAINDKQAQLGSYKERADSLIQQYGNATEEKAISDLEAQLTELQLTELQQSLLPAAQAQVEELEKPFVQYTLKKSLHDKLIENRVYQQLVNDPLTLLKNLTQTARSHFETIRVRQLTDDKRVRLAEFERSIDEISSEDNLPSQTSQAGLEEKQDDYQIAVREKCFQLCSLVSHHDLFPNSATDLCKEDCDLAYAELLKTLYPGDPSRLTWTEDGTFYSKMHQTEVLRYLNLLDSFSPAINGHKQTQELYDRANELTSLSALTNGEHQFCTDVLRTAILRINHPTNIEHKTNLDKYAKQIESEQANPKSIQRAKMLGILGAVVLLASIIAICVVTFGAATPAAIPLAAKIVCSIGCIFGVFGMFGAYKKNQNAQLKGDSKKIHEASNAITKLHAQGFFDSKRLSSEAQPNQAASDAEPLLPRRNSVLQS